jgi:hypothetical protein
MRPETGIGAIGRLASPAVASPIRPYASDPQQMTLPPIRRARVGSYSALIWVVHEADNRHWR